MDIEIGKDFDANELIEIAIPYGLNLVGAIAIFVIGRFVAKILRKVSKTALAKAKLDDTLSTFLSNVLYAVMIAFITIAALTNLGVETTSLAAIVGAIGLAVGLAFQDSIGNVAAGIMLVILRPFSKGDFIEAGGVSGSVIHIDILATELKTPDNKKVIVPNGKIFGDNIINYSANNTRRVDLVFGIGYDDDLKKAKSILEKITAADKRILKDPATVIAVGELGDSSVNLLCRPWVKTPDYWDVHNGLLEEVKLAFDKAGISIPFPQMDVWQKSAPTAEAKPKKKSSK